MSSVSIGLAHGVSGLRMVDFTVGTAAPSGGTDVEVRFNNTDTNSHNILDYEIVILLRAIIMQIDLIPRVGGAAPPPLV
jgi:hypothetical protein